jgi:dTDP-4-amino-4,6-dideoxygalactose transaminase
VSAQTVNEARATVQVPFVDLRPMTDAVRSAFMADVEQLLDSGGFVNGSAVGEFEAVFARYCGTAEAVGVASGLDALRFALLALELEPGDEVILPANTFIATAEAVVQAGARPVLVDVSTADYNLDVAAVSAAITKRTRAVMPVHLYGQMADMRALLEVTERHALAVIEDACQAHGASRDGIRSGTAGWAAAFSFYPAKNLGAFGDAGALVTDDAELAALVRSLREHGQRSKYRHERLGYTGRLDTLQALALMRKLPFLDDWNAERSTAAAYYSESLAGLGDLVLPAVPVGSDPVWHLYAVRTGRPEALAGHLAERGVGTGRHYPEPVHLSQALAGLGDARGSFPVTEQLADETLSLPMFPGISEAQLEAVVSAAAAFFRRAG